MPNDRGRKVGGGGWEWFVLGAYLIIPADDIQLTSIIVTSCALRRDHLCVACAYESRNFFSPTALSFLVDC